MKHFQQVTSTIPAELRPSVSSSSVKVAVMMGRRTWESLPSCARPLPGRINIILTRSRTTHDFEEAGALVAGNLDGALELAKIHGACVLFVIGGVEVFRAALQHPSCDRIYLTRITREGNAEQSADPYPCDVFMPPIPSDAFHTVFHSGRRTTTAIGDAVEERVTLEFLEYARRDSSRGRVEDSGRLGAENQVDGLRAAGNPEEEQYLDLVRRVLRDGCAKSDRTGVGTLSLFGATMRFGLQQHRIPLLTTKRVFWRGVVEELLWFLRGSTDAHLLSSQGIHIWDGNGSRAFLDSLGLSSRREGDLGPVYGFQWRHFGAHYVDCDTDYTGQGFDQLQNIVETLRSNPNDRRMVMTAWNPSCLKEMALPPCHLLAQFYVANNELSCAMYQRSCDLGLGVPFNIASYSLLTIMMAHVCGFQPGEFIHMMGDVHIYRNHVDALREQLERTPRVFPKLTIRRQVTRIDDFVSDDFELVGYDPHGAVRMEMAV